MSVQVPDQIKKCRECLAKIVADADEPSLRRAREQFLKDFKEGDAKAATAKGLIDQYLALSEPTKEPVKLLKSFRNHLQESMKEGLEQAKEKGTGEDIKLKKHAWYTSREDLVDELGHELTSSTCMKTEVDYYLADMQGKFMKLQKPKEKKAETEPAGEVSVKEESVVQEPEVREWGNPQDDAGAGTQEQSVQIETVQAQSVQAQSVQAQTVQARSVQMQTVQAQSYQTVPNPYIESGSNAGRSMQQSIPEQQIARQGGMNDLTLLQMQVHQQEGIIKNLEANLEENSDYKKKYKEKKRQVCKLEEEVRSLKAEKDSKNGPNRGQEKFQAKMQANHQQLLQAIQQGMSEVRLEVLRSK